MSRTGYPQTDHTVLVRGFAVILHEVEYLDLISRHAELGQGDYGTYLTGLHHRMSAARHAGKQVLIGPFLADQYESYAEAIGESASSTQALRAYDGFVARIGPHTRMWNGEPISHVVASLREATDTSADQATLLPLLKQAADQHTDPQHAVSEALDTATEITTPLPKRTESGHHTLTCAIQFPRELVSYDLPVVRTGTSRLVARYPSPQPKPLTSTWTSCAPTPSVANTSHPNPAPSTKTPSH